MATRPGGPLQERPIRVLVRTRDQGDAVLLSTADRPVCLYQLSDGLFAGGHDAAGQLRFGAVLAGPVMATGA